MSKNVKRSMRNFSAEGKLMAIQRVHDGESKASVARDIGVPESTLRGWCKNEAKIKYLSRQSSPDTDESEPSEKKARHEDADDQPFNLSLRASSNLYTPSSSGLYHPEPQIAASNMYTPNSQSLYTPMDCTINDMDNASKTPQNLSIKNEIPKLTASQTTERERTRAELARMSVELGLNKPEMFTTAAATTNLADLTLQIGFLSQIRNYYEQLQRVSTANSASRHSSRSPKDAPLTEEYINMLLKKHASSTTQNGLHNSALWNWFYNQAPATTSTSSDKPILYQQLTKESPELNSSSSSSEKNPPSRSRSVLDNLLNNINNNYNHLPSERNGAADVTDGEAVAHGEKFLKWLESSCSDPSVTKLHLMQFRTLLDNVKKGVNRKNGDSQNKTKVKRK